MIIMTTIYKIELTTINDENVITDKSIVNIDFTSLSTCNNKIKDYAEVYRKSASFILHRPGQSVTFFKNYRMEFTRLPSSNTLENFWKKFLELTELYNDFQKKKN